MAEECKIGGEEVLGQLARVSSVGLNISHKNRKLVKSKKYNIIKTEHLIIDFEGSLSPLRNIVYFLKQENCPFEALFKTFSL